MSEASESEMLLEMCNFIVMFQMMHVECGS